MMMTALIMLFIMKEHALNQSTITIDTYIQKCASAKECALPLHPGSWGFALSGNSVPGSAMVCMCFGFAIWN